MSAPKHFLDLDKFDAATVRRILDVGKTFKTKGHSRLLDGKALAMIFEKPSTRTRVSFEVGMRQLGGDVVTLDQAGTQLGRGETIADTARVLSRYVDAIMIRTDDPAKLYEMAEHATVPVINGLTDATHPCQIMADLMTFEEHRGDLAGKVVAWSGDGNNVAASWVQAAAHFGFEIRVATPEELPLDEQIVDWAREQGAKVVGDQRPRTGGQRLRLRDHRHLGVDGRPRGRDRHNLLAPYRVNAALMAQAKGDALFIALPARPPRRGSHRRGDGRPPTTRWCGTRRKTACTHRRASLAWCPRHGGVTRPPPLPSPPPRAGGSPSRHRLGPIRSKVLFPRHGLLPTQERRKTLKIPFPRERGVPCKIDREYLRDPRLRFPPLPRLVHPFTLMGGRFRGRLVRKDRTVSEILANHGYPRVVARMLGETLTVSALLATALKFDGVFTLQTKGDGPISMLVADLTSDGDVRGYAGYDEEQLVERLAELDAYGTAVYRAAPARRRAPGVHRRSGRPHGALPGHRPVARPHHRRGGARVFPALRAACPLRSRCSSAPTTTRTITGRPRR